MRILSTSTFSKLTFLFLFVWAVTSLAGRPLVADDKPEPRLVKASESVELLRIAVGLTHVMKLEKEFEERFSKFESDFLFDVSSALPGMEKAKSDVSFGQCVGVLLPELENYTGIAFPLEASELFGDEDYELGEDADGNTTVGGEQVVKTDKYFGFLDVSDEIQLENSNQITRQLIDYVVNSESELLTIESYPAVIGRSLLKNQLTGYRAVLDTAAQRQDDESDLDYSWRSLASGHLGKLVELFFRDAEKVTFKASNRDLANPFIFEVAVDCRKKSELLAYFQEMKRRRNRSLSWLHPNANAFATVALALPEQIQKQILTAGTVTAASFRDEAGLSVQAVGQTEGVFRGIAESGAFEILLQQIPFDAESECYVGVVPLASGSVFDSELVQLVSDQDSLTTITEIDGWPVYLAEGWLGLDLGEGWVPCVVATDSMLSLVVFREADQEKGLALTAELIRREFSPARRGVRYANAILAAEFSLSDVVNFMESDRDGWTPYLPTNSEPLGVSERLHLDQDQVRWSLGLDGQRVIAKCYFEPNAMALGVLCFEVFVSVISDVADL